MKKTEMTEWMQSYVKSVGVVSSLLDEVTATHERRAAAVATCDRALAELDQQIADRVYQLRHDYGQTTRCIADALGQPTSQVRKWLRTVSMHSESSTDDEWATDTVSPASSDNPQEQEGQGITSIGL